jgi:hypothetical protein
MDMFLDMLGKQPKKKKQKGLLSKSGMMGMKQDKQQTEAENAADFVKMIREARQGLNDDTAS